jgi:hypothetical protein
MDPYRLFVYSDDGRLIGPDGYPCGPVTPRPAEIEQLEGSPVHELIRLASDRLENEDWFAMSESVYAELPEIGISKALVAQSMVTGALRPVPEHIVVRRRLRWHMR